jgi:hypothetical protein
LRGERGEFGPAKASESGKQDRHRSYTLKSQPGDYNRGCIYAEVSASDK